MVDELEKKQDKSSAESKETSKEKTFTQTDIDKIRSDAAAEVGRAAKAAEDASKSAQRANERTNKYIEQSRIAELEAKRDEPDALSVIRARHAKEELEDKLAAKDAELESVNKTVEDLKVKTQQSAKSVDAQEIASRLQVDVSDLLNFTDGSKEAMEGLAQKLSKTKVPLRVDPGGGTGGDLTVEMVRNMTATERAARSKEIADLPLGL